MARIKYLDIGSISSGTMREEDLIPAFAGALESVQSADDRKFIRELAKRQEVEEYYNSEESGYDMEELFYRLENHCPAYTYFSSHEGDGADYGVWISWDSLEEDCSGADPEVLKVNDTSEVPCGHSGYVLHVNDHGNSTLYNASRGRLREVWSVV